jgi:hypothetical protein
VTAERHDRDRLLRAEFLVYESTEGFATGEPRGALCHGRAGAVESSEGKNVELAEEVNRRARGELMA